MSALSEIGGDQWFNIGDLDLAMHVERTHWLQWRRKPLSAFAEHVAARFGIAARIAPMTDDMVSTWISTEKGLMPFQHYFVKERCEPAVHGGAFRSRGPGLRSASGTGRFTRSASCGDRHLPVQSLSQHRPDPRHSRHAGADRRG